MMEVLTIKSPFTFICVVLQFFSWTWLPNKMNSVFEGFIFSWTASIRCLIVIMQDSNDPMVAASSALLLASNSLCTLWLSAKPLNCKSSCIASQRVLQYSFKTLVPAADPWGTLYLRSISFEKELFISTLKDHGWGYSSNQWSALLVMPYLSVTVCNNTV